MTSGATPHRRAAPPDLAPRPRDALLDGLATALRDTPWHGALPEPMPDKGLAHDHVRLHGTGLLARIPKQSQMGLPAADNLAYQEACFRRAAPSGHTPLLHAVLPPSPALPHGALIVEEIQGDVVSLPRDLPAIATALARIHALALPPPDSRPPLLDAPDPLAALRAEIDTQATHLATARLAPRPLHLVRTELARLNALCAAPDRPARRLISFDAHPGNYIRRPDGTAVLVDLEKARYSYPSLDLAHATLYTSTTWDIATSATLSPTDIATFTTAWETAFGPGAADIRRWHVPLRRAMWLWSVTWCAKWRALSGEARKATADGEDWSEAASDAALIAHVRDRVDHYLSHAVIAGIIEEFAALDRQFDQ